MTRNYTIQFGSLMCDPIVRKTEDGQLVWSSEMSVAAGKIKLFASGKVAEQLASRKYTEGDEMRVQGRISMIKPPKKGMDVVPELFIDYVGEKYKPRFKPTSAAAPPTPDKQPEVEETPYEGIPF